MSLVWGNHKAEKNASVSHSVRLEKSPWLKKKKALCGKKNDEVGNTTCEVGNENVLVQKKV